MYLYIDEICVVIASILLLTHIQKDVVCPIRVVISVFGEVAPATLSAAIIGPQDKAALINGPQDKAALINGPQDKAALIIRYKQSRSELVVGDHHIYLNTPWYTKSTM